MSRTVKMSDDIVSVAENETLISGRSLADQIEYWARIGRAIDQSPTFDYKRITAALSAQVACDDLSIAEQEVFFAEFSDSMWSESDTEARACYSRLTGPGLDDNDNVVFPGGKS